MIVGRRQELRYIEFLQKVPFFVPRESQSAQVRYFSLQMLVIITISLFKNSAITAHNAARFCILVPRFTLIVLGMYGTSSISARF